MNGLEEILENHGIVLNDDGDLDILADKLSNELNEICENEYFYGLHLEVIIDELLKLEGELSDTILEEIVIESLKKFIKKNDVCAVFEDAYCEINEHLKFRNKPTIDVSKFFDENLQMELFIEAVSEKISSAFSKGITYFLTQKEAVTNLVVNQFVIPVIDESEYDDYTKKELKKAFADVGKEIIELIFSGEFLQGNSEKVMYDLATNRLGIIKIIKYRGPLKEISKKIKIRAMNLLRAFEESQIFFKEKLVIE